MTKHDLIRYNMVIKLLENNNRQDLINKFNEELNQGKKMDLILADICIQMKSK